MKRYLSLFLLLFLISCEQLGMKPTPSTDPKSVFDQVWNFANDKYAFFEFKNVDWNKAYNTYSSRVKSTMTDEELFKVCYDLLYELKDEHVNLITDFNISRNPEVFLDYPTNFFSDVLDRNYFHGRTQIIDFTFNYFEFNDVAYVRYSSFMDDVSEYAMDYIMDKIKDKKGLIIDVRDNGGGSVTNIDILCERFITEKTKMGVEWHKSGIGKDDFKGQDVEVDVKKDIKQFLNKPVVILTNRGCYSATNRFAAYMKGLPNITLVGGQTGGGGGLPTATELSNGWILRVSGSQFIDRREENIENGVSPDVKIDIQKSDIDAGKDAILEKAISLIRSK